MVNIINQCPKCERDISEQEWGKNPKNYGKPYHAWRHVEKNPDCDFIKWCDKLPPRTSKPTQQDASQIVALRELYLLTKAVGISLLSVQALPPDEAEDLINENLIRLKSKK